MKRSFQLYLYNLISFILFPFFLIFLLGALVLRPPYRQNIAQRFGCYPSDFFRRIQDKPVFWVHAASVGEVMMSRRFVQSLKKSFPEAGVVLSTITPTGQLAARKHLPEIDCFIYFPFDFFWITRAVVQMISPVLFVFMETEIWPNCLRSLSIAKVPTVMANGRISHKSFPRYRRLGRLFSKVLDEVSLFLMQSEQDAARIISLGAAPGRVENTGNMKYDQAVSKDDKKMEPAQIREALGLCEEDVLMVAGSTRPGEEDAVLDAYKMLLPAIPSLTLLIAPRHLGRLDTVEKLLSERGFSPVRKGEIAGKLRKDTTTVMPVIMIDTLGELAQIYALGTFIFVGGGLASYGGHNILEPAAFGKPVFFGTHMDNFQDIAMQMLSSGGGIEVSSGKEMGEKMLMLAKDSEAYEEKGSAAYRVVLTHQGAVARNLERVIRLMGQSVKCGEN